MKSNNTIKNINPNNNPNLLKNTQIVNKNILINSNTSPKQ